jgi:hypothetical protein
MRLRRLFITVSVVFLSVLIGQDTPTVNSTSLDRTSITPVLDTEIEPGQNLIYCATFQLAWNELRDSFPEFLPEEPEIIKQLDKKMFVKDYLSEDCYVAMSGWWKNIYEDINRMLREKFGDEAWPLTEERALEDKFTEGAFMAYAFLFKNLMFPEIFESLDEPIWFISGDTMYKVNAFGIKEFEPDEEIHRKLGEQVWIYYYNHDHEKSSTEFVIELKSKSSNDEIIIAQIAPGKTLLETIVKAQAFIAERPPDFLKRKETLQIPKIDYDIEHNFTEIENYLGAAVGGPAKAYQRTKFKLDQEGAMLKSEAIIMVESLSIKGPRRFIVSGPFLIYLRQKDSPYPYFAMWVDNGEVLQEYRSQQKNSDMHDSLD